MSNARILVDRHKGGFGDLMMISRALKHLVDEGALIDIVLDRQYWPLFRKWKSLQCIDKPSGYYDYAYRLHPACPAAMIENRWANHNKMPSGKTCVPSNRVEIFAEALGISLAKTERIPYICLGDEERKAAFDIYSRIHRPFMYLQADTNESYRTWPHVNELCVMAKRSGLSIISHGIKNAKIVHRRSDGIDILTSCALIEAADIVVTSDSMALHAAAAFERPCVAVFGPIGAKTRTSTYPQCRAITAEDFDCMPCWRNQEIPCMFSHGEHSACLEAISAEMVMSKIRETLDIGNPLLMQRKTVERS